MHTGGKGYTTSKNTYSILRFNERGEIVLLDVDVDVKILAAQLSLPQEPASYERTSVDTLADLLTNPTL